MIRNLSDITLLVDGIIFKIQKGKPLGISNVWRNLLQSISTDNRFKKVIVLDRGLTPRFPGLEYADFPDYQDEPQDTKLIGEFCQKNQVTVFISTYFTSNKLSYRICFLHDFIPEKMGMNLNEPEWIIKAHGIRRANGYIAVSNTTKNDFIEMNPDRSARPISVVYNSISSDFKPHSPEDIDAVKAKYGITKKYFLTVGQRMIYKNTISFIKAFAELENKNDFQIVCAGGYETLEYIFKFYLGDFKDIKRIAPDNSELSTLLSGAEALAYPSLYEGFGMPIIEAMASGCPVIISSQAKACVEIGEDAVMTVDGHNVNEMKNALVEIQRPEVRDVLIRKGFSKVKNFSTDASKEQFYQAIADNIIRINHLFGYEA